MDQRFCLLSPAEPLRHEAMFFILEDAAEATLDAKTLATKNPTLGLDAIDLISF